MLAIHRMMDPFAPSLLDEVLTSSIVTPALSRRAPRPQLEETEDSYRVSIFAPGVKTTDIQLSILGSELKCVGSTRARSDTHTHVVNWTVTLPRDANTTEAVAGHFDGIVLVKIPKRATELPREVAIEKTELPSNDEPHYTLTITAPGMAIADLKVTADAANDHVKIRGSTKRTGASIDRSYQLPRDSDASHAEASHVDGILTIKVPKKPQALERVLDLSDGMTDEAMDEEVPPANGASTALRGDEESAVEDNVMV